MLLSLFERTKKTAPELNDRIHWDDPRVLERINELTEEYGRLLISALLCAERDFLRADGSEDPAQKFIDIQQEELKDLLKTIAYYKALVQENHRVIVTLEHIIVDLETGRIRSSSDYSKKPHLRLVK